MDLETLKVFYVAAKERSISKAALILGRAQPNLSNCLKNLQNAVGVPLYVTGKFGFLLTDKGQLLFEKCQRILAEVESIKKDLKLSEEAKGQLKVTTTHAVASQVLVKAIPQLVEKYPEIDLTILGNDQPLDLTMRDADVAIRSYMEDAPHLEQEFFLRFHIRLFASQGYLEKNGTPRNINDLENHVLISYPEDISRPYESINWHLRLPKKNNRFSLKVNSSYALQKVAELGVGIISISEETLKFNKLNLVHVLPDVVGPIVDFFYTYPKDLKGNKKIMALQEILTTLLIEEGLIN